MPEKTKNLCAQIPESLHNRVREEQERSGQTLSQYVTWLITEFYNRKEGANMGDMRTLAAQISAELFDRVDAYCERHKLKKKEFVAGLIGKAMDELEAAEAAEQNAESVE